MGLHTADAIVLRRYPFRETSVIVSVLTERHGKLKGLVKGLRGATTRHRSQLEPLTVNHLVFYDTRASQLHLISQCELLAPFTALSRDLDTMRAAAFFAELVDVVVPLEEPQPSTYRLLRQGLEYLALGFGPREALRVHFIVRLLHLAGFQPQVDECTGCGTTVGGSGYWSARQGGLLCPLCLHEDPKAERARPDVLEAVHALSQSERPVALEAALVPALSRRLDEFLRWRLDHPLKTMRGQGAGDAGQGKTDAHAPRPTPHAPHQSVS